MSRRGHGDAGAGVFGMAFGIGMFLAFLLFAVQLLFNLYASSVVTSAANDAARQAAIHGRRPTPGELAEAERDARDDLGDYASNVDAFDWSGTNDQQVRLRVHVIQPRVLPKALASAVGMDEIDRTIEVRIEQPVATDDGGLP